MLSPEWLASLSDRQVRDREKLFLSEGLRFLHCAIDARAEIIGLAFCPELLACASARRLVRNLGVPSLELTSSRFGELARNAEPQGVLLVARQWWTRLIEIEAKPSDVHLVLDNPRSPGNVGTILRSAEAFGASSVWFVGGDADPYDPACVRASMGAIFNQRLVRTGSKAIAGWKKRRNCRFIGTSAHASKDIRRCQFEGPIAIVMGSERSGIRPNQEALCDELVRIPMIGPTDSLNLGVAASVVLYQAWSSRCQ